MKECPRQKELKVGDKVKVKDANELSDCQLSLMSSYNKKYILGSIGIIRRIQELTSKHYEIEVENEPATWWPSNYLRKEG